ncbi:MULTISPECIES: TolC family protein [Methylococcus]|uniref:TolC family protein n=1 Tax=Methylococcus capsulatus TaxID=414 RepID=A0ABZ2FAP5_METCP|nr:MULTISPECIES: TolC family protein [Methylococcus]MDF9393582.1 TolC family protein [Methylococcus capsulatus]
MQDIVQSGTAPAASPAPLPSAGGGIAGAARELTLNQAIGRALEADPQIKAGLESIRQAEADLVTAGLLPNPELTADVLMIPWAQPWRETRQGGPTQTDALVSFPIDWFLFGKRAAAIVTAQKGVDVTAAQFSDLLRRRIAGTIAAFYDVLEAQALLDLARVDLDNLSQLEQITANRVELGGAGTIELDRVKVFIFGSRREVRSRETALATAIARLRTFLGYSDDVPLKVKGNLDVAAPAAPLAADAAFALAEENRPDLIAWHRQIAMAAANVELEERRAYPEVKPAFGYTNQFQHEMNQANADSWNVILQMRLPVFDRNQGNITKARSLKSQAEHNLTAQLVSLRAEILEAVKNFEAARDALLIDDPGQLDAARNVRDKIRAAYELGGKPLIDVLDAQRAYRETFRLHIVSRSSYWHSLYALNAAIGKQVLR